jgi:hypothetical protein
MGVMGSGKSTLANMFIEDDFKAFTIADVLRDAGYRIIGRRDYDAFYGDSSKRTDRVRKLMQGLGDLAREYSPDALVCRLRTNGNVVVTDIRMLPEATAIQDMGGYIVKIERKGSGRFGQDHPTETIAELATHPYVDYVIDNNGDLVDLKMMQRAILNEISGS